MHVNLPAPPTPASAEAVARGCTCDPAKNDNGMGVDGMFYPKLNCPVHGLQNVRAALRAGQASIMQTDEEMLPLALPPRATGRRLSRR